MVKDVLETYRHLAFLPSLCISGLYLLLAWTDFTKLRSVESEPKSENEKAFGRLTARLRGINKTEAWQSCDPEESYASGRNEVFGTSFF